MSNNKINLLDCKKVTAKIKLDNVTSFNLDTGIVVCKADFLLNKGDSKSFLNYDKTYNTKPAVMFGNENVFPEIYFVKYLIEQGWNAVWVDSFHRSAWKDMPKKGDCIPFDQIPILRDLKQKNNNKISGCWDIFAWNNKEVLFIESKGIPSKDKIRDTQINWYKMCIANGIPRESFLLFEWNYNLYNT